MEDHKLSAYLNLFARAGILTGEAASLPGEESVTLVSCDSREVIPGTLFVRKGSHFREEYLRQAEQQGAFCYVSQDPPAAGVSIPCIQVSDVRLAMARAASLYYGSAWRKLQLIGITGTKGKSTTTYYVKSILDRHMRETGQETGVISSIDTYDGEERFESHLTTPEPLQLHRHFANAAAHGLQYMVMEVSSQALKYDRVEGVQFNVACFLNIGYDHISPIEHPDWEDYFSSKLRIFQQCKTAVVDLDTEYADRVLQAAGNAERMVTFSRRDPSADVYGFDEVSDGGKITFRVRAKNQEDVVRLNMPGLFNVQNALAAIAISMALAVPRQTIYQGLQEAQVPGRMETYSSADRHITVIVDYAHNGLSFETLFSSVMKEYPGRRITIVFGCPGKKSLDRRRDLGRIAGTYAQHVYLTEEDPGEEDAEAICREIAVHVSAQGCSSSILVDRGDAIRAAVADAARDVTQDTVLLVTGKGRETREKRGLAYVPVTSDVEYVRQALQSYDGSQR